MAEKGAPLQIIPYRSDEAPFACIEVNIHWVPFLIAAVYPSRYPEAWLGTLEENRQARLDVLALINQFMKAVDCTMSDNCCPENLTIIIQHRIADDQSSMEMTIDGGVTWFPDKDDPREQIPDFPAPVGNVVNTKCDAADNIVQGLQEAQVLVSNTASGQGTLQEIALNVVLAILAFLLLPPAGALLLVPLVMGIIRRFLDVGKANYDALFSAENWDKTRCAFFCALDDDGKLSAAGMAKAKKIIFLNVPGGNSPNGAAANIVDLINFVGLAGLNLCAYTYQATGANCDACDCPDCEISLDFTDQPFYWLLSDEKGIWEPGVNKGWKTTYKQVSDTTYYTALVEYTFVEPCFDGYCHFSWFITDHPDRDARMSYQRLLEVNGELVWESTGFNISPGNPGAHTDTAILSTNFALPVFGVRLTLHNLAKPVGHFISSISVDNTP